eukprot:Hpha_TRINITY_DN3054_c0_g1::TRINITY_DN3054_c0_g1_i1::g.138755::m.138755
MILHLLERLNALRIVLGSTSPRRLEILTKNCGLRVHVEDPAVEENLDKSQGPEAYVRATARLKADAVVQRLQKRGEKVALIVCSDSIVCVDGAILEKPKDEEHAHSMLKSLSGRTNTVMSALVLVAGDRIEERVESTEVDFAEISEAERTAYVLSGEPFGKAGGYGIQGTAATFIRGIRGDYYNVMGFPLNLFCQTVRELVEGGSIPLEG